MVESLVQVSCHFLIRTLDSIAEQLDARCDVLRVSHVLGHRFGHTAAAGGKFHNFSLA